MTTTIIVQARTGSSRLPGKVLAPLAGRPMLGLLLARLDAVSAGPVVVATTDGPADDPVADLAASQHVPVVRGPELDVLRRFRLALDAHPADVVVRLTADCPLADPAIVDLAVDRLRATGVDYVSNTLVRTYPDGLDVEAFRAEALLAADAESTDAAEREHVTAFIYRRTTRFRLRSLRIPRHLGEERWTVDTADDLDRLRGIVDALDDPVSAGFAEILAVAPPAPAGGWALEPAELADTRTLERLDADPGLDRIGPATPTPDVAGTYDDGATRLWLLTEDGTARGWLELTVRDGIGHLRHAVPSRALTAARELVARALRADRQVTELAHEGRHVRDESHHHDREAIHDR